MVEMNMMAQKLLERLPLKFKDESFGAMKIFQKFFWSEVLSEVDRK